LGIVTRSNSIINANHRGYALVWHNTITTLQTLNSQVVWGASVTKSGHALNEWWRMELAVEGNNVRGKAWEIGTDIEPTSYDVTNSWSTQSTGYVGLFTSNLGMASGKYDDFCVRKYVSPEPSHGSWGSEEFYPNYDYVLKVSNQGSNAWSIFLTRLSDSNIIRLSNLTIWFYDGAGVSKQIQVIDGSYTQTSGSVYNLSAGGIVYIAMAVDVSSSGASNIVTRLEARAIGGGVSEELKISFNIT